MPRNKKYRGVARLPQDLNFSTNQLRKDKRDIKLKEKTQNDADRFIYESSINGKDPRLRFDYSNNVFSFRGDWKTRVKVVTLFFPFIVSKSKCKKFEELVNKAFETIFLD